MRLKSIELSGFKSFAKKTQLEFASAITSVVGPNGSGKSNIAESFRFVLGEQSMKSMRGKRGEDMIWNGSAAVPRGGRASVKLVFDNSDRALNLDFDEVALERVVYRDGGNDYLLNGSQVRLRDISELLSQANIGATGHHIISQGEADRALSASARERREMIEDALGLTAYLYKKVEAERKLEKTAENMREVSSLRRELAPHLRFLQNQVKKIEQSEQLRNETTDAYLEYFKRESVYLRVAASILAEENDTPKEEHTQLNQTIAHLRGEVAKKQGDSGASELVGLEQAGRAAGAREGEVVRELGRIEGEMHAHERISKTVEESVPAADVRAFAEQVEKDLEETLNLDVAQIKNRLSALVVFAKEFLRRMTHTNTAAEHSLEELRKRKEVLEQEVQTLRVESERVASAVRALRTKIEGEKDANREAERELFAAMARRSELETVLAAARAGEEKLTREREQFKQELGEAAVLIGRAISNYEEYEVRAASGEVVSDADIAEEARSVQEDRRRKLERMKIRLEELGAGNSAEVLKEHAETAERDAFLAREIADLEVSAQSLRELIEELTKTLQVKFVEGIEKINSEFDRFFKLMFGGGSAVLAIVKETKPLRGSGRPTDLSEDQFREKDEGGIEEGVEITIALPHKRIKGLHMLSGGERALTSIALIFAMSQVNPPPFLILDETDAALDEANSRRYGDMIESLAEKSQLILITHNRETMSRAGVLYGVTMGQDGVSKLLSVKFEEAVAVAK
ncbi:MAG: AAA family ATPase [Candidatus Adlerbacteria bacterium]|nr:AAA family ATPase [Candidatus Adlerbacteria bacterium]